MNTTITGIATDTATGEPVGFDTAANPIMVMSGALGKSVACRRIATEAAAAGWETISWRGELYQERSALETLALAGDAVRARTSGADLPPILVVLDDYRFFPDFTAPAGRGQESVADMAEHKRNLAHILDAATFTDRCALIISSGQLPLRPLALELGRPDLAQFAAQLTFATSSTAPRDGDLRPGPGHATLRLPAGEGSFTERQVRFEIVSGS